MIASSATSQNWEKRNPGTKVLETIGFRAPKYDAESVRRRWLHCFLMIPKCTKYLRQCGSQSPKGLGISQGFKGTPLGHWEFPGSQCSHTLRWCIWVPVFFLGILWCNWKWQSSLRRFHQIWAIYTRYKIQICNHPSIFLAT